MSTINTTLSILWTMLIKCVCIRSYNKLFRKPQKSLANFLALIEIASESYWLIFLFVIKPGYLPEQPASHGPGEGAAHLDKSLWLVCPCRNNCGEADQVRFSPLRTWVKRGEDRRKEKEERGRSVSQTLCEKWWKQSPSRSLWGTCTYI